MPQKASFIWLLVSFVSWLILLYLLPDTQRLIGDYAAFSFLGVLGALFANATGAGGGVVFIPAFEQLDFSVAQSVASSFAIQCLGMTTGAIAWTRFYSRFTDGALHEQWRPFVPAILTVTPFSILGMWLIYALDIAAPGELKTLFGWFSILLGCAILLITWLIQPTQYTHQLTRFDKYGLAIIGLVGGAITAWLSVGVGEIMAIFLILRRYNVTVAIASAVVVSALTVWAGIAEHALFNPNVYWQVVLFAGPGAILGALLARQLATRLPVRQLKMFFAAWVLIMGLGSVLPAL